jgi:hypothetical protein
VQKNFSSFSGRSVSPLPFEAQTRLIEDFILEAGLDVSFREIEARTNEAYEMLLWRGLIEDPLWNGMSGAALAVALIVPVQRSSTQNAFSVNALSSKLPIRLRNRRLNRLAQRGSSVSVRS